tara:strand:- start:41 stop:1018 length:978 start_codon:yes stop_codon:yes gene_type:complete
MEKNDYDFLVVYNTCGVGKDNTDAYIRSLKSIINSKTDYRFKVVMSSFKNSDKCVKEIEKEVGESVEIIRVDTPYPVNITYNNACIKMVKKYGEFKGFLYVDSGVDFVNNETALDLAFKSFITNDYIMLSIPVNNDHGFYFSKEVPYPVTGKDAFVGLGGSVNGHVDLFSYKIYKRYRRVWPDVFAGFCTESTFSFIAASLGGQWALLKDVILNHATNMDGRSSWRGAGYPPDGGPAWENLLFGRKAQTFIDDKEAQEAGLGYEEGNNIMLHKEEAYCADPVNDRGQRYVCKDPERLAAQVEKYFYSTDIDIDYEKFPDSYWRAT